tara:strand:- start:607 stop:855 length:249 start_codon:yes stop_codon:yes gene_type:complete
MINDNRTYVIFGTNEVSVINFTEVLEDSENTLRRNVDNTKTFVKYEGQMPASVSALTTKSVEYTGSEILDTLSAIEWQIDID